MDLKPENIKVGKFFFNTNKKDYYNLQSPFN